MREQKKKKKKEEEKKSLDQIMIFVKYLEERFLLFFFRLNNV